MNWTIERVPGFTESMGRYAEEIVRNRRNVHDEITAQVHLLARRDWLLFDDAIKQYEAKKSDPRKELPQARDCGRLIPDTYYIRVGDYYAFFLRDPEKPVVYESVIERKEPHGFIFGYEQWEKLKRFWR